VTNQNPLKEPYGSAFFVIQKKWMHNIINKNNKKHFQLEMFFYATNSFTFSFVSTACTGIKVTVACPFKREVNSSINLFSSK